MSDFIYDAQKEVLKALLDEKTVYYFNEYNENRWYFCIDGVRAFAISSCDMHLLVCYDNENVGSAQESDGLLRLFNEATEGDLYKTSHIELVDKRNLVCISDGGNLVKLDSKYLKIFGNPNELQYRYKKNSAVAVYKYSELLGLIMPVRG